MKNTLNDLKNYSVEHNFATSLVEDELRRGERLIDQRKSVKREYLKLRENYIEDQRTTEWKWCCRILKPAKIEKRIPSIFFNRDILSRQEHINILAQPKVYPQKQYFTHCVTKRILPCTARIQKLSRPRNTRNKSTSVDPLSETCKTQSKLNVVDIKTALLYWKEEKRERHARKILTLRECKKLKEDLLAVQKHDIKEIIKALAEIVKDDLVKDSQELDGIKDLTNSVSHSIMQFTGFDEKNQPNYFIMKFIKTLALNIAIWINNEFETATTDKKSQSKIQNDQKLFCKNIKKVQYIPIDDYIRSDESIVENISEAETEFGEIQATDEFDDKETEKQIESEVGTEFEEGIWDKIITTENNVQNDHQLDKEETENAKESRENDLFREAEEKVEEQKDEREEIVNEGSQEEKLENENDIETGEANVLQDETKSKAEQDNE